MTLQGHFIVTRNVSVLDEAEMEEEGIELTTEGGERYDQDILRLETFH